MTNDLPIPIAGYIAAENASDADALTACFIEDAAVKDENETRRGLAAIKQWAITTKAKYHHSIEPLRVARDGEKTVVTNRLAGDFPGSPIELQFIFTLSGDKIASLEIDS